jgi:hypothetical protein
MADLERRLAEVGRGWDPPATPNVAAMVTARLADAARPARRRPRRALVVLIAALVGAGAVAAIAPAREAILDLFSIGGAEVREVPVVPAAPTPSSLADLDLGEEITVRSAPSMVTFPVGRPTVLPTPSRVFIRTPPAGGMVSFVWTDGAGLPEPVAGDVRAVLSQFTGRPFLEKLAASGSVQHVTIGGEPAVWLPGPDHVLIYEGPDGSFGDERGRLVSRALVWTARGITYRLEGGFTKERAIAVAESLATPPAP